MCNCPPNTNPCPDNATTKSIVVKWSEILNKPTCFAPCLDDLDFVPLSRTITINGTVYDLSANRSWTIATGSATLAGLTDVDITGIAAGKFLSFNGTDWVPQTVDASKWTLTGSDIYRNSNVAIGTSTISGKLHVAGNIHVSGGDINIFNTSNNRLSFGTNNTERVRIDANGVVGIGVNYAYTSAASGNKLLISDSLTPSGTNVDLIRLIGGPLDGIATNKYVGINFEGQGLTGGNFGLAAIRAYDIGSYRGHLTFWTDPGVQNISLVERYRITHDGKHGFGTTNPTVGFHINGLDFLHDLTTSNNAFVLFDGANGFNAFRVDSDTGPYILLGEGGMYNVGIGLDTPTSTLHVDGTVQISNWLTVAGAVTTGDFSATGNSVIRNAFSLVPTNQVVQVANYVLTATDNIVVMDAPGGGLNLTLPTLAGAPLNNGRMFIVYNRGTGAVTPVVTGAGSIIGPSTIVAGSGAIIISYSATQWLILPLYI
jgi:hypothetical protein